MAEIYFAQIREDSQVERMLLHEKPAENIVCIGSGGCTAFSLVDRAKSVTVVDANPSQIHLIELKLVAAVALELAEYLEFVGEKPCGSRLNVYQRLKTSLSPSAAAYWDQQPARISHGLNRSGATERFYAHFSNLLCNVVVGKDNVLGLFDCGTVTEQTEYYSRHFENTRVQDGLKLALSKTVQTLFYPAFWYARSTEFDFYDYFVEQLSREVATRPLRDNYFLSQMMLGTYLHDQHRGVPHYLTQAGFNALKGHAERIRLVNSPLQSFLSRTTGVEAYFISNVFDWGRPSDHLALQRSIRFSAASGAIILTRNMYKAFVFDRNILTGYAVSKDMTRMARVTDRSVLYRDITVGILE